MSAIISILVGLGLGGLAAYYYQEKILKVRDTLHLEEEKKTIEKQKKELEDRLKQMRDEVHQKTQAFQQEEREKRRRLQEMETKLLQKEQVLDKKVDEMDKMKDAIQEKTESLQKEREKVKEVVSEQERKLQELAQLTKEEAQNRLLQKVELEFKDELVGHARRVEKSFNEELQSKAKQILADAIQRYASETTMESTTTAVVLPSDDLKGRIIGREGRNINAFETVTGVDVIVDDTPGSILISGFDPIRRYMAKLTLERLVEDGRIHPARIEEAYEKVKEEANVMIKELGDKAAFEVGVAGLPSNLIKILGRLRFRIAYGQNVLKHSIEVAFLAAELAGYLGANVELCKKAGLLHDIGKAVDHEVQGKHAFIGRDLLRKLGMPEDLVHCVEANEGDVEAQSLEAKIVQVANLISVSRPGANKDNLENFIKRLHEVEQMATQDAGVEKAFAVQSGKELRVFVRPSEIDDLEAIRLSHKLARRIETELKYPGQIKVEVIRELRVEAYAESQ